MKFFLALPLLLATALPAAFDAGGGKDSAAADSSIPQVTESGDSPTAYPYARHELRMDVRFYAGGGLMSRATFGIFPRFSIGGGLNVPSLIGAGPVSLRREDAAPLVKLLVLMEGEKFPAFALGWEGPAYEAGELRGLYGVLSKEFKTPLGYFQLHGGANSSVFEGFQAGRDLRAFAGVTSTFRLMTVFAEADEVNHAAGPRFNAGARIFFDPISLGVEFREIGGNRGGPGVSRILKVSYTGLF